LPAHRPAAKAAGRYLCGCAQIDSDASRGIAAHFLCIDAANCRTRMQYKAMRLEKKFKKYENGYGSLSILV
jgi:hypothetical protein